MLSRRAATSAAAVSAVGQTCRDRCLPPRRPQGVPRGDVLGTYDTYPEAQSVIDRLAKADFPVAQLSIVGNDLKTVERVTRKLSWHRRRPRRRAQRSVVRPVPRPGLSAHLADVQRGVLRRRRAHRRGVRHVLPTRHLRASAAATATSPPPAGARDELPGARRPRAGLAGPGAAQHFGRRRFHTADRIAAQGRPSGVRSGARTAR